MYPRFRKVSGVARNMAQLSRQLAGCGSKLDLAAKPARLLVAGMATGLMLGYWTKR
jgi:hypothetical protein